MSGGFLAEKPFFSKPQSARNPKLYVFEAVLVVLVLVASIGAGELRPLDSGRASVEVAADAFAFNGVLGLYGVRLSSWIAILRRNRMPQTLEWLATLIPFAAMILCFVFSGALVRADAASHGYRFCSAGHERESLLRFARAGAACSAAKPLRGG